MKKFLLAASLCATVATASAETWHTVGAFMGNVYLIDVDSITVPTSNDHIMRCANVATISTQPPELDRDKLIFVTNSCFASSKFSATAFHKEFYREVYSNGRLESRRNVDAPWRELTAGMSFNAHLILMHYYLLFEQKPPFPSAIGVLSGPITKHYDKIKKHSAKWGQLKSFRP